MGLEHIIAIYIYCNFPDIRMAYLGELMSNTHTHFGRLLREIVEGFGLSVFEDDAASRFYLNISVAGNDTDAANCYFNGRLSVRLCQPVLTTTNLNISHLYNFEASNMSMVLTKASNNDSVSYFNCNWISNSSLDNEALFVGGRFAMNIQSIIIHNVFNYGRYMKAINVLYNLIKGKSNTFKLKDPKLLKAISKLTTNKVDGPKKEEEADQEQEQEQEQEEEEEEEDGAEDQKEESEDVSKEGDDYMMQYFSMFCANITIPIYLNLIWILDEGSDGYHRIKHWVINDDCSWIRFDVLCKLFPNVNKVKIGCGRRLVLKMSTFEQFVTFFTENTPENGCNLRAVVIDDANEEELSVENALNEFREKFAAIGWKLDANKFRTKIFLTHSTDSGVWDDLLSK